MERTGNRKIKLLYLERMFRETGKEHVLSMQEILEILDGYGVAAERKSVYADMETLRAFGMDIQYKRGKSGGYYLEKEIVEPVTAEMQTEAAETAAEAQTGTEAAETAAEVQTGTEAAETTVEAQIGTEAAETISETIVSNTIREINVTEQITAAEETKPIKLLCDNRIREEAERVFGTDCVYKEKGADRFTVSVQVKEDSRLYGWLASMGKNVHILKPRKAALAYREYLKSIVKEYKDIGK